MQNLCIFYISEMIGHQLLVRKEASLAIWASQVFWSSLAYWASLACWASQTCSVSQKIWASLACWPVWLVKPAIPVIASQAIYSQSGHL